MKVSTEKNRWASRAAIGTACSLAMACGSGDGADAPVETRGPQHLVYTGAFTPDGTTSLLHVVGELGDSTNFDPSLALEFGDYIDVSVPPNNVDGAFFVGLSEEPRIQRYVVGSDGTILLDGELSLAGLGVTTAANLIEGISFVAPDRAYFVDVENLQVIVFNPTDMTLVSDYSLEGLKEDSLGPPFAYFKNVDAGRIVVAFAYPRGDESTSPMGKLAIIDPETDTVTYDEQTQCGFLSWTARDQAGNLYFVSHSSQAVQFEAGLAGDPSFPPCMVRMLSGSDGFDPDYYLDLREVAGGPAGALLPGTEGRAYTFAYTQEADPITVENADAARRSPVWAYHSLELGNEATTFAKVPGLDPVIPFAIGGEIDLNDEGRTSFITSVAADFSETEIFDTSDPDSWQSVATVPNFVYGLYRLR